MRRQNQSRWPFHKHEKGSRIQGMDTKHPGKVGLEPGVACQAVKDRVQDVLKIHVCVPGRLPKFLKRER